MRPISSGWAAEETYEYGLGVVESLGLGTLATFGAMNMESKPVVYALGMASGAAVVGAVHCGRKVVEYWHLTGELLRAEQAESSL